MLSRRNNPGELFYLQIKEYMKSNIIKIKNKNCKEKSMLIFHEYDKIIMFVI